MDLPEDDLGEPLRRRARQDHTLIVMRNALRETCNNRCMAKQAVTERIEDADALLLAAVIALEDADSGGCRLLGLLPRRAWATTVLTEQLLEAFGHSPEGRCLSVFSDPQRGVIPRRVTSSFDRLANAGYLVPVGVGDCAAWRLAPAQLLNARRATQMIGEECALRRAAQRTLAIVDAWSKTFRAGVPTRSGTSTSSAVRRQRRPA